MTTMAIDNKEKEVLNVPLYDFQSLLGNGSARLLKR
jgi:hypothetical protein